MEFFNPPGMDRRSFLKAAGASTLASMFHALPAWAQGGEQIHLNAWIFSPGFPELAEAFTEMFPNVTMNVAPPGATAEQVPLLHNALRAGAGIPDIVQLQQRDVNSFAFIGELADLDSYGASDLAEKFPAWIWEQSQFNGSIVALPHDLGPMAMVYRQDIFERYDIEIPTTWEAFREEARKLRSKTSDVYLTNLSLNQAGGWANGLFWAAGARPFRVDGDALHIHINNPAARRVCEYWDELLAEDLVEAIPSYTPEWFGQVNEGRYATYLCAAWLNSFTRNTTRSAGLWRAAMLPQWDPANPTSGVWSGSSLAVTARSPNQQAAADYVKYVTAVAEAVDLFITEYTVFPALIEVNSQPSFANREIEHFGGQQVNQVFLAAMDIVDTDYEWSPINGLVEATMDDEFAKAGGGEISCVQALDNCQNVVVAYAEDQGFTVTTG